MSAFRRRPAIKHNPKANSSAKYSAAMSYARRPIDYSVLDHIGVGGFAVAGAEEHREDNYTIVDEDEKSESGSATSASFAAAPATLNRRYASLRKGSKASLAMGGLGGSALSLQQGTMRVPAVPTVPKRTEVKPAKQVPKEASIKNNY